MKKVFSFFFIFFATKTFFAQTKDSLVPKVISMNEVKVVDDYENKYKIALRRVRRVYPLALYAAKKLKEIDAELATLNSKHKQKKYNKATNEQLKEEFIYVFRGMNIEDGKLLMKLVQRESGLTVSEIIKKYRGNFRSELLDNLAKIWEQDLDAKYDANGDDWIVEQVIQDINNKKVSFNSEVKLMSKEDYKEHQVAYKAMKKEIKKQKRKKRKSTH